ncbi:MULTISPECIES: M15 family metallopeptidase [Micrococcaceae]|uniref:LAS superfamily LD-carboxypeptidase LdcB n=2 Tax=Micrococcaceae TaxID=1268 RepID=A0AAJ1SXL6_9MICC|nr:M15 family metallopeptidase [Pseudarthrobacter niigatensis]MDQ0148074.1 LAS superfamily LD-carboxypeptidase LdcB [Pseudarthrobacter niigatensis]MDQ0268120.1 LAS superfamily LD-carboxypeptidase LdcB [Pseudarthrobacter niigatensis]
MYDGHVGAVGSAAAAAVSAYPSYSEHHTGWPIDIGDGGGACSFEPCFADQPAATWASANAHRFGFVIRYPAGAEADTGYSFEPWHLRYVGVDAATEIHDQGITLEEFTTRHSPN